MYIDVDYMNLPIPIVKDGSIFYDIFTRNLSCSYIEITTNNFIQLSS